MEVRYHLNLFLLLRICNHIVWRFCPIHWLCIFHVQVSARERRESEIRLVPFALVTIWKSVWLFLLLFSLITTSISCAYLWLQYFVSNFWKGVAPYSIFSFNWTLTFVRSCSVKCICFFSLYFSVNSDQLRRTLWINDQLLTICTCQQYAQLSFGCTDCSLNLGLVEANVLIYRLPSWWKLLIKPLIMT